MSAYSHSSGNWPQRGTRKLGDTHNEKDIRMITIHARHTRRATYVGFVRVSDGPSTWTESTDIHRGSRADALADAAEARTSLLQLSMPSAAPIHDHLQCRMGN
jgi:hypothetical protein